MSNYALLNSPNPPYDYTIENAYFSALNIGPAITADTTGALNAINIIQNADGSPQTLTLPIGTYDIQMIATIATSINNTIINYASLGLINNITGKLITVSNANTFISSPTAVNYCCYFNNTQRIVLTSETTLRLVLFYANATFNAYISGNTNYSGFNQNARLIVNQTF